MLGRNVQHYFGDERQKDGKVVFCGIGIANGVCMGLELFRLVKSDTKSKL